MKKQQWLCALMATVILLGSLVGCQRTPEETESETEWEFCWPMTPQNGLTFPTVSASTSEYTLTDADIEEFYRRLDVCDELIAANRKEDVEALEEALYYAHEAYAVIDQQSDIAYLLYCQDYYSDDAWDTYYESYLTRRKGHSDFWSVIHRAKRKNDAFETVADRFSNVAFPGILMSRSSAVEKNENLLVEIEAELQSLGDNKTKEQVYDLLNRYLVAAKKVADGCGYQNYYDYVAKTEYFRDFGDEERQVFREYVKTYIVPLGLEYKEQLDQLEKRMSWVSTSLSNAYNERRYDRLAVDYLAAYIESLPMSARNAMESAFRLDRIVLGESGVSRERAFVRFTGNTPLCYFNVDDMDLATVSHELGHYYADVAGNRETVDPDVRDIPCGFDIKETHSQTNTLLMVRYMDELEDGKGYEHFRLRTIYEMLYSIVRETMKDEFDDLLFSDPQAHTYTADQLTQKMSELVEAYRIDEFSPSSARTLSHYWQWCLEDCAYNLCYAVSAVVALQIYAISLEDYSAATEYFCRITEDIDKERSFVNTVSDAGLGSVFEADTYLSLIAELGNEE